jgi:hypothetical protein
MSNEQQNPSRAYLDKTDGNLIKLYINKMSWAKREPRPIWLERRGFTFQHHPHTEEDSPTAGMNDEDRKAFELEQIRAAEDREDECLLEFIREGLNECPPRWYTERTAREDGELKTRLNQSRRGVVTAIERVLMKRKLSLAELPKDLVKGARKHYLVIP